MAAGPGISLRIARKQFARAAPLFDGLKLEVAAGSVLAVTGRSGVGKSTLLRMIAGIDRDFDGNIEIGGTPAHLAPAAGYVPQDARLLPWLTVADNLGAIEPNLTRSTIDALLGRVGLGRAGSMFPHQLSGGMARRAALARGLAANVGLLLLDEPFVSLDRQLTAEMIALLRNIIETFAPTILLVTHDVRDAAHLADTVVELGGRPAQIRALSTQPGSRDGNVVQTRRARGTGTALSGAI